MAHYITDLHIHSRFSMATSKALNLAHLAGWAGCKGIHVLGTGDLTHPKWRAELREGLVFDEDSGFYRFKGTPEAVIPQTKPLPPECTTPPLFCLQTEISSIYKRGGRVRKVHNVVLMPTLEDADAFSAKLARIGNIESDGRPILGLDSHDLLELVLETSDRAVLIPAHIWTPWFSLFGSKSGFDRIEDCFGDLTDHIFALETGLSSDPDMNRLISALDRFALVSNSDAHSGPNLGREANLFTGKPSYDGMIEALRCAAARKPDSTTLGSRFEGTLEIYPEEGKYHLDGHRNCGVVMTPGESQACGNICPVCGKPLTIGVLHRVWELADRREVPVLENEQAVHPIIPLPVIIAEIMGGAPTSKKVQEIFQTSLQRMGSEFGILASLPIDEIKKHSDILAEAVRRIRSGELIRRGGYDGEFGTVQIFTDEEMQDLPGGRKRTKPLLDPAMLHPQAPAVHSQSQHSVHTTPAGTQQPVSTEENSAALDAFKADLAHKTQDTKKGTSTATTAATASGLTSDQEAARLHRGHPLLVLAGPGSGKTHLLVSRLATLARELPPSQCIALTFSNRAADEISQRLVKTLPSGTTPPFCGTFHSLAWRLYRNTYPDAVLVTEQAAAILMEKAVRHSLPGTGNDASGRARIRQAVKSFSRFRESLHTETTDTLPYAAIHEAYAAQLANIGPHAVDFTGLLEWATDALATGTIQCAPSQLLVDEVQDLSPLQLAMLSHMLPATGDGFFGIGDPDQSIYGFRGATGDILGDLKKLWPGLQTRALRQSFRSGQEVLSAASHIMCLHPASGTLTAVRQLETHLNYYECPDHYAEARWIAGKCAAMLGATSHTLLDAAAQSSASGILHDLAPSDIAVLVRTRAQIPVIAKVLRSKGIPVQIPSEELWWQEDTAAAILLQAEQLAEESRGNGTLPSPLEIAERLQGDGRLGQSALETSDWKKLCSAFNEAGSWQQLFDAIRWQDETELLKRKAETVSIMTIHAAKGLEYRAVFIPGLEEGLLPFSNAVLTTGEPAQPGTDEDEADINEERRVLYVALTRASEAVFISRALTRRIYGKDLTLAPSRFLEDFITLFHKTRLARKSQTTFQRQSLL